jgi:hypothetical protein
MNADLNEANPENDTNKAKTLANADLNYGSISVENTIEVDQSTSQTIKKIDTDSKFWKNKSVTKE